MTTYILRRLLMMIPTLILISILAFTAIELPPGDFLSHQMYSLQEKYGESADQMIENLRERYGLDDPIHVKYFKWIKGIILDGDFGRSFAENKAVIDIILSRVLLTMAISLLTLLFTWIIAIPIGVYSAVKQYSIFDYIFTFFAFIGRSIPNFLLALVLMFLVYNYLGWNVGGLLSQEFKEAPWSIAKMIDLLQHLSLPVIVIGTAGTAGMVRVLRSMFLDELNKEYVQTARSKGLSERVVIWKHIFIIAIQPLVSTIGWLLPRIVSGAAITSVVLNLPTTGGRMLSALQNQDMYVAGGFILLLSTLTIIGTLISDILLAYIDPRIRYN